MSRKEKQTIKKVLLLSLVIYWKQVSIEKWSTTLPDSRSRKDSINVDPSSVH